MTAGARRTVESNAADVLVVDDDQELCELMALRLGAHGFGCRAVHNGLAALAEVKARRPHAVILDLRLDTQDGLDVLRDLLALSPELKVLVLTAHGTIETAVEAMRRGAKSFLTKPFRDRELLDTLAEIMDRAPSASACVEPLVAPLLVGDGAAMRELRQLIERLASTEATILVTGESGTGKELVARSLHDLSPRARGPFVAVNCGSLPPELLTSELFGHTKGAFTGATHEREGVFGAAHGGTLFLDEIGEALPEVQVRLLRVLQERRYTPVGSTREKEADVRVVAATNRDLAEEVALRRFREDLYYRLRVIPVHLPPLRERAEDIPQLAALFLERIAARHKLPAPRLAEDALSLLCASRFPGNVRQLNHVMEAALLLNKGNVIDERLLRTILPVQEPFGTGESESKVALMPTSAEESLPSGLSAWFQGASLPPFAEVRRELERAYLIEVLRRSRGNVTAAAKMAGRHRTDFYELLRRHNLTSNAFRPG